MERSRLESKVLAFVVEHSGCNPKKVRLHSRIAEDLGIDGDDAVELFEAFAQIYKVDLGLLHDNWSRHFGPEGGFPPSVLAVVLGCIIAGLVVSKLSHGNVPTWVTTPTLLAISWWVAARFAEEYAPMIPITIQDLVDAAAAGSWIKTTTNEKGSATGTLFRTLN